MANNLFNPPPGKWHFLKEMRLGEPAIQLKGVSSKAVHSGARHHGVKVTTRTIDGLLHVWRVKKPATNRKKK